MVTFLILEKNIIKTNILNLLKKILFLVEKKIANEQSQFQLAKATTDRYQILVTGKSENSYILTSMEITNQSKRDFKSLSNNIIYTIIIKGHHKFRKLQRSKYCRNHIS